MDFDNISRRLRGAIGNAVVWGAGWTAAALAVFAVLKVAGILPESVIWLDSLLVAARFGVMGGIAGAAISPLISFLYRGRRLSDIRAVRFGIGGGIAAGLFVPAFLQAMNLLSGGPMVPMELVMDDGLMAALFGAVVAGGSLKLAQRANPLLSRGGQDRPGLLESGEGLASAEGWDARRRSAPAWRSTAD
jgi:hypothetical protein